MYIDVLGNKKTLLYDITFSIISCDIVCRRNRRKKLVLKTDKIHGQKISKTRNFVQYNV